MSELATHAAATDRGDLSTRTDVHDLVVEFYREVVLDEVLEPIFGEVAEVDWAQHIPKLIDYWCQILLGEGSPAGSVTAVHRHLHRIELCKHIGFPLAANMAEHIAFHSQQTRKPTRHGPQHLR